MLNSPVLERRNLLGGELFLDEANASLAIPYIISTYLLSQNICKFKYGKVNHSYPRNKKHTGKTDS